MFAYNLKKKWQFGVHCSLGNVCELHSGNYRTCWKRFEIRRRVEERTWKEVLKKIIKQSRIWISTIISVNSISPHFIFIECFEWCYKNKNNVTVSIFFPLKSFSEASKIDWSTYIFVSLSLSLSLSPFFLTCYVILYLLFQPINYFYL